MRSIIKKIALFFLVAGSTSGIVGTAVAQSISDDQSSENSAQLVKSEKTLPTEELQHQRSQILTLNRITESLLKKGRNAAALEANNEAIAICGELKLPEDDELLVQAKRQSEEISRFAIESSAGKTESNSTDRVEKKRVEVTKTIESITPDLQLVHWQKTGSNCSEKATDGMIMKFVKTADVEVQVALIDTGRRYRAEVAIKNVGLRPIDIQPKVFKAVLTGKDKPYELKCEDAAKLAKCMVRDTKVLAALVAGIAGSTQQLCASMQTTQSTVYSSSFGSGFISGSNGFGTGTFRSSGVSTISSPNVAAQIRADQDTREYNAEAKNVGELAEKIGEKIVKDALKTNTLEVQKTISGTVFFERRGYGHTVTLTLPIGNEIIKFPFGVDNPSSIAKTLWYGPEKMRGLRPADLIAGKSARSF